MTGTITTVLPDSDIFCVFSEWLPRKSECTQHAKIKTTRRGGDRYRTATKSQEGVNLGAPLIDWKPYEALKQEEKIEGVRIELTQLLRSDKRKYQIDANPIRQEICDSKISVEEAKEILRQAANTDSFDVVHHHVKDKLRINLDCVTEPDVLNAAKVNEDTKYGTVTVYSWTHQWQQTF